MRMKWKVFAGLLVFAGLVLIFSPFIKERIIDYMSGRANNVGLTAEQANKNNQREATFDFDSIQPPSFIDTLTAAGSQEPEAMIGRITVASVGIRLPILKGTTNAYLLIGATTMRPDQEMGEGNYPLAGHHMRQQSLLFGPLLKIKNGAEIVITDMRKDYIYRVTSHRIVSAMAGDVINETKEKQITLITCDRATRTDGRLVVRGKLVAVKAHDASVNR